MESAVHIILASAPQSAAILISMLLVVMMFALALARPQRPVTVTREAAAALCAEEIAIAADRAAATARRYREIWLDAQDAVDRAWADYERADAAVRRVTAATVYPTLTRGWSGAYADRERNLHRAATAACRRHEISIAQLNDALAHRGWDPALHPIAQEIAVCAAARENRLAAYSRATAREREAWADAEAAATALAGLREEAVDARVHVGDWVLTPGERWWAEQWTATTQPLPVTTTQPLPVVSTVEAPQAVAA